MKTYKNIFVTFISAILTVFFVYGGYTIYAESEPADYEFKEGGLDYYTVFELYHDEMNTFFNKKITQLNNLLQDENFLEKHKKKIFPPDDIDFKEDGIKTILEKCGDENVSTYCVSIGALDRYIEYLKVLNDLTGTLAKVDFSKVDVDQLLALTQDRNAKIEKEVAQAKQVMEATLATYNEFRLAYQMHKKYEVIIKDLIKYKLTLKDLRKRVTRFPQKFIDSTSDQCE